MSMCEYMLFSFQKLCSRIYIFFKFRKIMYSHLTLFLTWRILQFVLPIILRSLRITAWSRFFVALLNHMQNYSMSMCEYMLFSFRKLCSRIYIIFKFRKSCICTLCFFLLEECFDFSSLLLWGVQGFSPRGNYKMTCQNK